MWNLQTRPMVNSLIKRIRFPMNEPTVSVILAVKNGERFIALAINSVLASNKQPLEIIVVDGDSVDGTEGIAKSFPTVRFVKQVNRGIADAYNLGIESSRGEFIAFISHDDIWEPHKLNTQIEYMVHHPLIQYTVAKVKHFLEPGQPIPPGFRKELLERECVGYIMETLVARKSLFDLIGNFDTWYSVAEDVDWFARAKDQRIPMAIIPEVLVRKRVHASNASLNARDNDRQLLRAMRQSIKRQIESNTER
jgi:glycosyltransferase involved in cell wall biosynthesis